MGLGGDDGERDMDTTSVTRSEFLTWLKGKHAYLDALAWARATPGEPEALWTACPRGDWLLWLAGTAGVDRRAVVNAACACAREALVHVPDGEDRPRLAIEAAEAWTRGGATLKAVRRAVRAAGTAPAYAAAVAAAAAYADDAAAVAAAAVLTVAVTAAAAAAAAAAYADAYAYDATRAASLARSAELVREWISWAMVEDAIRGE